MIFNNIILTLNTLKFFIKQLKKQIINLAKQVSDKLMQNINSLKIHFETIPAELSNQKERMKSLIYAN
jgi:seryl-tRNA synthetase